MLKCSLVENFLIRKRHVAQLCVEGLELAPRVSRTGGENWTMFGTVEAQLSLVDGGGTT